MFQDLDGTLAALLEAELAVENVVVSFAAPDDQFPPSGVGLPAVSMFLYDIRENTQLRSNQWELERDETTRVTSRRRPPVRIDCSYLITAWPSDVPEPAADEHLLLGEVMKVLLRHRAIPARYLQGELDGQDPPVRARVLAENQLQSLGELWQAMGGKPKAALHYGITLSVDLAEPEVVGPQVRRTIIRLGQGVPTTEPASPPTDP